MRAEQLGAAIGATVHTNPWTFPTNLQFKNADVIIVVKRLKKRWTRWVADLRLSKKRIVWDAVDFWQQPEENGLNEQDALRSFYKRRDDVAPHVVLAATERMARDCGAIYLPHHHRIGLMPTPPRERVETIGYEGNGTFIESWRPAIESECARRGWNFVVNPERLTDLDIVVSLRGGDWDGGVCRRWKSGVKYANSIAAGRPVITQRTAAFDEMAPPGTAIENAVDLTRALNEWAPLSVRLAAFERAATLEPAYRLDTVAQRYRKILLGNRPAAPIS